MPEATLRAVQQAWYRRKFPPQEITIYSVKDALVAAEGLVFDSSLRLIDCTISQHSEDEITTAYQDLEVGIRANTIPRFSGQAALCKKRGVQNYGHWLIEMLPKAFVTRKSQLGLNKYIVPDARPPFREIIFDSMRRLGIENSDIIETNRDPIWVDTLIIVDGLSNHGSYMSPVIMDCLDEVSANVSANGPEWIFVLRDGKASRQLINRNELMNLSNFKDFTWVEPGHLTLHDQISYFKSAKIIVGVMGAEMSNLAFSQPGTSAFVLTPANMADTFFWFISGLRKIRYTEVRCRQVGRPRGPMTWDTDIVVSLEDANLIINEEKKSTDQLLTAPAEGGKSIEKCPISAFYKGASHSTAANNKEFLESLMYCPLMDMGDAVDGSFSGIFVPAGEVGKVPPGVTQQFFNEAHHYYERCDTSHTEWLLKGAFKYIETLQPDPLILDVGSGPGTSVIASLNILERPTIIASDVSPILLRILRSNLASHAKQPYVSCVTLDLNKPWFKKDKFDLIIGAAVLHHLFEPDILITNLFQSVKPGGSLIFFEPFENGHALLCVLVDLIIETSNRLPGLDQDAREFLERMNSTYQTCGPKPVEEFSHIDDKWTFTRQYFSDVAEQVGASLKIYPLYESASPFTGMLTQFVRDAFGKEKTALPEWAWELIDRWEKRVSLGALNDMLFAGGVILTKSIGG